MDTQEIRLTAQITLKVSIDLDNMEILDMFTNSRIRAFDNEGRLWSSFLDIISVEDEHDIYENE